MLPVHTAVLHAAIVARSTHLQSKGYHQATRNYARRTIQILQALQTKCPSAHFILRGLGPKTAGAGIWPNLFTVVRSTETITIPVEKLLHRDAYYFLNKKITPADRMDPCVSIARRAEVYSSASVPRCLYPEHKGDTFWCKTHDCGRTHDMRRRHTLSLARLHAG
jgi:hypothetical protein